MEKPWFKEYDVLGIPRTLEPYPDAPVFALLDDVAEKYPRMGCVQLGLEMKYPEVKEHADKLATALADLGVKKGDVVATMLPTSIQFIVADYGISKAGAIHVPSSFLEPVELLEHKFREAPLKAMICVDADLSKVEALGRKLEIENIILTNLEDYSANPPKHKEVAKMLWLTDLIDDYPANPPKVDIDVKKDLETLLFTGGTTGMPKGCMLTHRNVTANALQGAAMFGPVSKVMEGNIAVLIGLPFFHSYGHSVMHSVTSTGFKQLLIPDARDTSSMLKMMKEYYPTMQMGVPTQYMKMLKEELKGAGVLGLSGSAALPPEVQEKFERSGGGTLLEGYGLSECSPTTHLNLSVMFKLFGGRNRVKHNNRLLQMPLIIPIIRFFLRLIGPKNFGRLQTRFVSSKIKPKKRVSSAKTEEKRSTIGVPYPDTDIKVVDVDTGATLSWDEIIGEGKTGEMCITGAQRMLGYWPEEGSGLDEEGYVHTGDVIRVDESGYFYIVDRTKDMIIVSGYKVYSREIDDLLYEHPAVEMAAAIGVPDPERPGSERVKVCIQLKPEHKGTAKEEEFIEYLRDKVAKYAVPKYVEFIDEMPLTEVQKVNKKALRDREKET